MRAFLLGLIVGAGGCALVVYAPPKVLFAIGCVACVMIAGCALILARSTRI